MDYLYEERDEGGKEIKREWRKKWRDGGNFSLHQNKTIKKKKKNLHEYKIKKKEGKKEREWRKKMERWR